MFFWAGRKPNQLSHPNIEQFLRPEVVGAPATTLHAAILSKLLMDLHGGHEQVAGLLEGAGPPGAAELRGDDDGCFTPPVRANELVEDPAQAAAVEPEDLGLRRRGPRAVAVVPWFLRLPGRPPAGPHIGVSAGLALDGGARGSRR